VVSKRLDLRLLFGLFGELTHFDYSEDDEEELERREAAQVLKQFSAADFEDFDAELTKAEVAKLEGGQMFSQYLKKS
jgi:hypothetical protein